MTRLHAFALGVAVVLAAAVGFFLWHDRGDAAERARVEERMQARDADIAERDATLRAQDEIIAGLTARNAALDRSYTDQRNALRGMLDRYGALSATIGARIAAGDTGAEAISDRALAGLLRLGDSTVRACTEVVATCESRVALRDTLIARRDSVIALLRRQRSAVDSQRTDERRLASIGEPRLRTFAELAYEIPLDSVAGAVVAVGAGAQLRLVWGVSGDALAQLRPGTNHPLGAAVRLRKAF